MFGCGRLDLGNVWWDGRGWDGARDKAYRERWRTTLDPARGLGDTKTPIAWFTGTCDQFYWLPSVMASYDRAAGLKHLSLLPNHKHALTPEIDEQVFAWLDVHLKGATPFVEVSEIREVQTGNTSRATWQFKGPRPIVRAELLLSHGEAGNWSARYWRTIPAAIDADTCVATLPRGGFPYFVTGTAIDKDGFRYSTPAKRIAHPFTDDAPDYDGCSNWGGFEDEGADRRHQPRRDAAARRRGAGGCSSIPPPVNDATYLPTSLNRMFLKVTSIGPPEWSWKAMTPVSGALGNSPSTVVLPFSLIVMCLPTARML